MTPNQFNYCAHLWELLYMDDHASPGYGAFEAITHFLSLNQIKLENTNDE